jgi:plasmid stabilization system protein ParE
LTAEFIVRPEAESDLQTAFTWHESQVVGLGDEFLLRIDAVFALIRRHPSAFPIVYESVRRAGVRRVPFSVFYVAESERTVVLSVLHTRQDPSEWPTG